MSCEATRRHLLTAERPDSPPPALGPHLAECAACRDWLRNLTELEARVPLLPVPASDAAKDRLLKQLREAAPTPEPLRVVAPVLPFTPPKERGLRKASLAVALAAAVVLLAVGLSVWPRSISGPETPVARPQADARALIRGVRDERMAKARTPRDRLEVLAEFADDLLREVLQSDALPPTERLELLAQVYEETVRENLLEQARLLAPDVRRKLLPRVASELGRTESEFSRLAAAAPDAKAHLERIAAAARDGDRELRRLAAEAST
jgi:hypothetical protein